MKTIKYDLEKGTKEIFDDDSPSELKSACEAVAAANPGQIVMGVQKDDKIEYVGPLETT